jgi:hypothetical protein
MKLKKFLESRAMGPPFVSTIKGIIMNQLGAQK